MTLRIDRYEVQRLVGQGAMGKVYLAFDPKLGRQVAIKVLTTGAGDEAVRQRFRLEARAIAALKHPNIVELYDYSGESASELHLVMEYIPGPSLDAIVRQHGNLSEPIALCIGHELALALAHAHRNQVVHRDIKPENVLVDRGRVVLTDFGIVKAVARSASLGVTSIRTRTQVVGTPGFMAPEQFAGRQIDARTDVFALGALLYCVTTGHVPFEGATVDDIHENLRSARVRPAVELNPTLSPGFGELVERCLAPRPKDRFQTAGELRSELLSVLSSHGVTEVRQELALYQEAPSTYAVQQRQRSVDVLLRDLEAALRDRDHEMAESIVAWVAKIAPLDRRLRRVTGELPALARPRSASLRAPGLVRLAAGLVAGIAIGVLVAVAVDLRARLPAPVVQATRQVSAWLTALAR